MPGPRAIARPRCNRPAPTVSRLIARGAPLRGSFGAAQIEGGVDQGHMRESLREIAQLSPGCRIVLFGQEADIIAQREQALEDLTRLGLAPLHRHIVSEPKAASEKRAL